MISSFGEFGWVFWITGLSGSGKSSVARNLLKLLRHRYPNSVLLDGDVLRQAFENDLGYSLEERRRCARRYCRLSRLFSSQGLHVVMATISMLHDCQSWNRRHLPNYFEVYLRAGVKELAERPEGQLYRRAMRGELKNVVGVDVPFEEPTDPDLIVDSLNSGSPAEIASQIWQEGAQVMGFGSRRQSRI